MCPASRLGGKGAKGRVGRDRLWLTNHTHADTFGFDHKVHMNRSVRSGGEVMTNITRFNQVSQVSTYYEKINIAD